MTKIVWKKFPHDRLDETHQISKDGTVRLTETKELVKLTLRSGYPSLMFTYNKKGKRSLGAVKIHRMVAKAFVANDDPVNKTTVNHINGDKLDCRAENLEWVTNNENVQHAVNNGLIKITKRAVIRCDPKSGKEKRYSSILEASKFFNISDTTIIRACKKGYKTAGYYWKYAEKNPNEIDDLDLSTYKQIKDFPNYVINAEGKVYSIPYKRFLKFQKNSEGTSAVQLSNAGKRKDRLIHRLVGSYFLKRKNSKHNSIHHIDGDKSNNNIENLEWYYVPGVEMLESNYDAPYYDPKKAIKSAKRKSAKSAPKDLLTANPKNLSKKQREERKRLLEKKGINNRYANRSRSSGSKTNATKKSNKKLVIEE